MKLEWAVLALADRDEIFDYVEPDNPRAAVAIDHMIYLQVQRLIEFPEAGRPGRIEGTRELPIKTTPYIAAYRILEDNVRILRILHGARQWPDDMAQ